MFYNYKLNNLNDQLEYLLNIFTKNIYYQNEFMP